MPTSKSPLLQSFVLLLPLALLVVWLQPGRINRHSSTNQAQSNAPSGASLDQESAPAQPGPQPTHFPNGIAVGHSVKNDESPRLRDIPAKPFTKPDRDEIEDPELELEEEEEGHQSPRPAVVDPVVQGSFSPSNAPAAIPSTSQNFEGIRNLSGVYPPDTNGDVGPNHYVQMVNLQYQVWNKSGTSLLGPINSNTLWSGFGGPCEAQNAGDPNVLYDSMADRWIMSQFTLNPYGECIAVSTSGDPTGSFYRYYFQFSTTVFYDYPHFGVWPDGYYMAANRFSGGSGASALVFNRSKMLSGQPATYQEAIIGSGTLQPADLDGSTLPPAGEPEFFIRLTSSSLALYKFHVDWNNPANSTFTGPTSLGVAPYNSLCVSTGRSCVPQPNTSVGLDGLGDRVLQRLVYRNFGDHETLLISHGANAASSGLHAGVRWYEIRSPNGAPTIYQQGTYAPDADHRWMGSIAMDKSGDIALGYSVSSSSVFPSIRYTGRLVSDPLGQMPQGETTMIAGTGSQTGTGSRWGDYAAMSVDPVDDCTFWFTTEYMATTSTNSWRTRIGSFKFPSCGGTSATNLALNKTATTSSLESTSYPASSAVDGNGGTRWSSAFSDPQWIQVDLGSTYNINHVVLNWEAAYGRSYQIQVSNDGATGWTNLYSTTTGDGGIDDLTGLSGSGRYIRMYGTARGTTFGYSLWEFEVYGSAGATNLALNKPATASASCNTSETPDKADNGTWTGGGSDKWCDNSSASKWWRVDLGQTYSLNQFVVYHAGAGGESASWNTKDFNIQVSTDGTNWTTAVNVTGNTASTTTHNISATTARYVRLNVITPTSTTDTAARIYEVQVFGTSITNLALNHPATASSSCNTSETPDKAVNGSWTGGNSDKWCSVGTPKWWQVDLGAAHSISQFVIYHAGAGGESTSWNTKDFNIQVSSDGVNWTTAVTVTGNTSNITTHNITPVTARYVRLNVVTPTNTTDTAARIYEVKVMGQ